MILWASRSSKPPFSCAPSIESPTVSGTLFEPLRDPDYFQQVRVELGAVAWPNGADLAPDVMYDAIRADGQWVVAASGALFLRIFAHR